MKPSDPAFMQIRLGGGSTQGMNLRDYIAIVAMGRLIGGALDKVIVGKTAPQAVATAAVSYAEALAAELAK